MSDLRSAGRAWLRRHFSWSNSREAWGDRLGLLLLLGAGLGIGSIRAYLSAAQEVLLWSLLSLAGAILTRRGWIRLLGPVLFYDLVRVARRNRYFLLRTLYACLLGLVLGWLYLISYAENQESAIRSSEMAAFAERFFLTFLVLQFLAVAILTPAYTAGAIAEEKDRKTLEFLLATDLRNREIVLSKLFARIANLSLLLLTGLPILSILQFLGGVDPNLVLAAFIATAATMVSLASLSILNSVLTKKPRDAIAATYLCAVGYLLLSGGGYLLLIPSWGLSGFPSTDIWQSPVTLDDVVEGANIGNPIAAVVQVVLSLDRPGGMNATLPLLLRNYVLFHGGLALLCAIWALVVLRSAAIKQSYGEPKRVRQKWRLLRRPPVGAHPMFWKEVFAESGLRLNILARIILLVFVVASFLPVGFILADIFSQAVHGGRWSINYNQLADEMNIWVRILGTVVACLLLLAVASRASSCVSIERDRQTLDALLTTPLELESILFAKWIGNIVSVRWGWLWLLLVYGIGILTGGLSPMALPLLLLAWFIYAAVLSSLGMWFSIVSRTTLRSTIATFLTTAAAGVGHWFVWFCFLPLLIMLEREPEAMRWLRSFQVGFTPPLAFGLTLPLSQEQSMELIADFGEPWEAIGFTLLGLFCWAAIAVGFWIASVRRFMASTGRGPVQPMPAIPLEPAGNA